MLLCQRPLTEKQTLSCARSLEDNKLRPQGGAALAEGLKGNSTLTSLKEAAQHSNQARVLAFLSAPLDRKANTFCACRLTSNKIGAEGGAAIAEALKGNSTLQSLE